MAGAAKKGGAKAAAAAGKKTKGSGGSWLVSVAGSLVVAAAVGVGLFSQLPLREQLTEWATANVPPPHRELALKLLSKLPSPAPAAKRIQLFMNGEHTNGLNVVLTEEFEGVEDLGVLLTPKLGCKRVIDLPDAPDVDPNEPCHVFNSLAQRIKTVEQVKHGEMLFLVPPDRLFVWPTVEVGRKITVSHVVNKKGRAVQVETLSLSPRVYTLYNFFDTDEADQIMHEALSMTDDDFKLKRSTTGTKDKNILKTRTSENAFVTISPTAMMLKRRIFDLLGVPFRDTWADGLQVLRYNVSKAYVDHLDYLDDHAGSDHSFDSSYLGTNRFATVVLYLSDVDEGGETVFNRATPAGREPISDRSALSELRRSEAAALLEAAGIESGSWEEKLVAACRARLAVKPVKGQAVLFYSQHPDGKVDTGSRHGACPVLKGQKWAANLWVWNGPRYGYTEVDEYGRVVERQGMSSDGQPFKVSLTAKNKDVEGAQLFFEDQLWKDWPPGLDIRINSFVGHEWNARVNGKIVKRWTLQERRSEQSILLYSENLDAPIDPVAEQDTAEQAAAGGNDAADASATADSDAAGGAEAAADDGAAGAESGDGSGTAAAGGDAEADFDVGGGGGTEAAVEDAATAAAAV